MKYQIKLYKGDMFVPHIKLNPKNVFEFEGSLSTLAKIIGQNTIKYDTPITSTINGWRVFEYQDTKGDIVITVQFKPIQEAETVKVIEFHHPKIQGLLDLGLVKGGRYV